MLKKLKSINALEGYGANVFWILGDKVFRLGVGLIVIIFLARYLGPHDFGVYSYVFAFVSMLAPISKLGLDGIISRDIARNECDIGELMSSAIVLKLCGSVILVLATTVYMALVKPDILYVYLAGLFALVFAIRSFEVIEFYFRARVLGRRIAVANVSSIALSALLKITLILLSYPLISFAAANAIEALFAMGLMYVFFKKAQDIIEFSKVSLAVMKKLITESWPHIISGFFALMYLNVDQIMIESMLGSGDLGQYAAASRLSSAWYFLPITIGWALQTAIVKAKQNSSTAYFDRLQILASGLAILAYLISIPIFIFSEPIIKLLYGSDYMESSRILSIHMWASIFVFVGSVRGLWVVNESYFNFALFSNAIGGLLNVLLNYIWLPVYGIEGAAWATLISYSFTYVFSGVFYRPALRIMAIQIKAMLLIGVVSNIILLVSNKVKHV